MPLVVMNERKSLHLYNTTTTCCSAQKRIEDLTPQKRGGNFAFSTRISIAENDFQIPQPHTTSVHATTNNVTAAPQPCLPRLTKLLGIARARMKLPQYHRNV
jgi:hypothetical protein